MAHLCSQFLAWFRAISMAITLLFLGAAYSPSAHASTPEVCPGGQLRATLPQPPLGYIARKTIRFNDNCTLTEGPVEIVPINSISSASAVLKTVQLPSLVSSMQSSTNTDMTAFSVTDSCAGAPGKYMFTDQQLIDQAGNVLNHVHSDNHWESNGTAVTSACVSASVNSYRDDINNWVIRNPSNALIAGCLGCAFMQFQQHAEFQHYGLGVSLLYYNTMDNYEILYGDGRSECGIQLQYRTWNASWREWTVMCGVTR